MARSIEPLLDALLQGIERELPRAIALRRHLHATPELAHAEQQTSASVAAELPLAGEVVAGTGLLARIGPSATPGGAGSPAAPVAVRAELDGLPLRERTLAPFAASGDVMHACGHDVHMAALVALTRAAHAVAETLPAPLLAVFQPSEEAYPSGAQQLADGPLGQLAPAAIVAAHVHPELRWGTVALDAGVVNASCDAFAITVEGAPSHGAYPHHGRDPILAIAQVVVALHAQLGRRIDPLSAASLTVGVLDAGSAENLIPAQARARGALRAHRPQDRLALRELVLETAAAVAAAHGCRASVELEPGEPALENDPGIVACARQLLASAGLTAAPEWRSCGSDDFAFFGALAPVAMAFVGLDGAAGFAPRPLHHPELLPPDEAVGAVARVQALLYVAAARAAADDDMRVG
ncbi:MAG TPA: M20 family metallopeptidase [Solirubrobacteraceae bacterium]|jgi:amidohydrolase|nr:M20 family metallopeptidase [Solirubrobacteraceae bacterium]